MSILSSEKSLKAIDASAHAAHVTKDLMMIALYAMHEQVIKGKK
jgi:hypothetical protein